MRLHIYSFAVRGGLDMSHIYTIVVFVWGKAYRKWLEPLIGLSFSCNCISLSSRFSPILELWCIIIHSISICDVCGSMRSFNLTNLSLVAYPSHNYAIIWCCVCECVSPHSCEKILTQQSALFVFVNIYCIVLCAVCWCVCAVVLVTLCVCVMCVYVVCVHVLWLFGHLVAYSI